MKALNIGLGSLRAIIAIVGVILCVVLAARWTPELQAESELSESMTAFLEDHPKIDKPLSANVALNLWVMYACAGAAIIFGILSVFQNPKRNMRAVIGVVMLGVIVFIGYSMASDTVMNGYWDAGSLDDLGIAGDATAPVSKYSGMGLKSFYILLGLTVASVIYLEVSKLFK